MRKPLIPLLLAQRLTRIPLIDIPACLGQAHFPMLKDLDSFRFADSDIDEAQIRWLYERGLSRRAQQPDLLGGTGTGKTHLAIAITVNLVRQESQARFCNLVDLANDLEQENLAGRGARLTASLSRFNLVVLDELGYQPFSKNASQLQFHLIFKLYEQTSVIITTKPRLRGMASGLRPQEDDHRHARPAHASL